MTCNEPSRLAPTACHLDAGHPGKHEGALGGMTATWSDESVLVIQRGDV